MQRKCAIYSFENLDGVASAAIMVRWAKLNKYSYKLGFFNYTDYEAAFDEMASLQGHIIFILDFSPEEVKQLEQKIQKVMKAGNKIVYWSSHMNVLSATKDLLSKYVKIVDIDEGRCAAYLASQRFTPTDKVGFELRAIAHDLEFWVKQDERSMKLADLITSGINKKDLVELLAKGIFWSEMYEKTLDDYRQKKEKAVGQLVNSMQIKFYGGTTVGFAHASSLLSTADAGQAILDTNKVDVSVNVYKDGKLSFRRNEGCDINLAEMSKLFDGGGHPYAAGGRITDMTLPIASADKFKIAIEHVDKQLREFFK